MITCTNSCHECHREFEKKIISAIHFPFTDNILQDEKNLRCIVCLLSELLPSNHCDYIGCLPGYVLLCTGKWTASTGYTQISTSRCQRCILFPVLGTIPSVVSFPLLIHVQFDQNANNSVKNVMISPFTPNKHSPFLINS